MTPAAWTTLISIGLFAGMLICLQFGYGIGERSSSNSPDLTHEGSGTIEAAVLRCSDFTRL
jgi:hypothetical protein